VFFLVKITIVVFKEVSLGKSAVSVKGFAGNEVIIAVTCQLFNFLTLPVSKTLRVHMLKFFLFMAAISLQGCASHAFNHASNMQHKQPILVVAQFPNHFQIQQNLMPIAGSHKMIHVDVTPWQVNHSVETQIQNELNHHYQLTQLPHQQRAYEIPKTNFWGMPNLQDHALLQEAQKLGAPFILLAYPRAMSRMPQEHKHHARADMQGLGIYQQEHVVGRKTIQHVLIELVLFDATTGAAIEKNYYQGSEVLDHVNEPIDADHIDNSPLLNKFHQHQNQLLTKAVHNSLLELGFKAEPEAAHPKPL
jgi:hypothetical protein